MATFPELVSSRISLFFVIFSPLWHNYFSRGDGGGSGSGYYLHVCATFLPLRNLMWHKLSSQAVSYPGCWSTLVLLSEATASAFILAASVIRAEFKMLLLTSKDLLQLGSRVFERPPSSL